MTRLESCFEAIQCRLLLARECRLVIRIGAPANIPVFAPLARREMLYRALIGKIGPIIRKFATSNSQATRVSQVIEILKNRFSEPMRIGELAREANCLVMH